jgi:hypothetical protein
MLVSPPKENLEVNIFLAGCWVQLNNMADLGYTNMCYSRTAAWYRIMKDIKIYIPVRHVNSDIIKVSGSICNFRKQSDKAMLHLEISVLFSSKVKLIAVTTCNLIRPLNLDSQYLVLSIVQTVFLHVAEVHGILQACLTSGKDVCSWWWQSHSAINTSSAILKPRKEVKWLEPSMPSSSCYAYHNPRSLFYNPLQSYTHSVHTKACSDFYVRVTVCRNKFLYNKTN